MSEVLSVLTFSMLELPPWVWVVLVVILAILFWINTFSPKAQEEDRQKIRLADAERRREDEEQRKKLPLAKRTFGLNEARKFAERPSVTDEDCRSYMEKCRLRGGKITLRNDFLRAQDACDAAKALAGLRLEHAASARQQT